MIVNIPLINVIIVLITGMFTRNSYDNTIGIESRPIRKPIISTRGVIFVLLFFEMALRGDFEIDTINYYYIFNHNYFSGKEIGFWLLIELTHLFSGSYLFFLSFIAFFIALGYTYFLKYSKMIWLSALILFCGGSFYTGFNIMRQILAAALFAFCYKFIISKRFWKYCLCVLAISTIHLSALFMLPFYFLLNIRWTGHRYRIEKVILIICICILLYFLSPFIVSWITNFSYQGYASSKYVSEGVWKLGTLKAAIMAGIPMIYNKFFNKDNPIERIIFNGCIAYLIIAVCGGRIFIIQRFTHYFAPCLTIAYPHIISQIQAKHVRNIWILGTCTLFIILGILPIIRPGYYFFWNNQRCFW